LINPYFRRTSQSLSPTTSALAHFKARAHFKIDSGRTYSPFRMQVGLAQNSNLRELRDLTARMSGYYREQDWTQALTTIELCRKAGERFGIGALYDTYAERIAAFRRDPPPADWDGVYEAESK